MVTTGPGHCLSPGLQDEYMPVLLQQQEIQGQDVLVHTKYGMLRGRRRMAGYREARGITTTVDWFIGIPYAEPPIGERRFQKPTTPASWTGIGNATRFGWVCPQHEYQDLFNSTPVQNEDCLYLNVYTPYEHWEPAAVKYPVLVYVHGGSYRVGTGNVYLGHVLAQYGVVVITFNYRLDVLGFLCSPQDGIPGNLGLLDQIQALQWVRDNIMAFRGDPDRVTVVGHSCGGTSVGLLTISPLAQGLFQQAIMQSGPMLAFYAIHDETTNLRDQVTQLAHLMGCRDDDRAQLVECMKMVSWQQTVFPPYKQPTFSPDGTTNCRPCVDDHVIPDTPRQLLTDGDIHVSSVMIGMVNTEWGRNIAESLKSNLRAEIISEDVYMEGKMNRDFFRLATKIYADQFSWGQQASEAITYEYTNWTQISDDTETRRQYESLLTDSDTVAPSIEQANLYVGRNVPVYFYNIDHHSDEDRDFPEWIGSYHGMELNYLFGAPFLELHLEKVKPRLYTEKDRMLSTRIMGWWSNYVIYGNPTPTSTYHEWRRYFPASTDYYYIHSRYQETRQSLRTRRVAFWNRFIPNITSSHASRTGDIQQTSRTAEDWQIYRIVMWVLVGMLAAACTVLVVLGICVCYQKGKIRKQKRTCQLMHGGIITLKFDEAC